MTRLLAWLIGILFCSLVFLFVQPSINTNILELISDSRFDIVKKGAKNNLIRVYFDGDETALDAALLFKRTVGLQARQAPSLEKALSKVSPGHLLSVRQMNLLMQEKPVGIIIEDIQRKLASPMGGFYSIFLESDPLLLLPDRLLQIKKDLGFDVEDGVFFKDNGALLVLELPSESSRAEQKALVARIEKTISIVETEFPKLQIEWSGILRFANSSASRMELDLNVLSLVNLIIIVAILLYCFRSIQPFFLCLLAIVSGMFGGAALVVIWKQSIHILTLGFGGSLLGACVDYPLHYFCSSSEKNRDYIFRSITFGALTTGIAFFALIFSGFEGLVEMALFSIGSVFFTWLTVYCVFPKLSLRFQNLEDIDEACDRLSLLIAPSRRIFLILIICLIGFGFSKLKINDDIRLLQPTPEELINAEKWIQEKSGLGIPRGLLFVAGDSQEVLNDNLSRVTKQLKVLQGKGEVGRFEGKYSFFPTLAEQRKSAEVYNTFLAQHGELLKKELLGLGYEDSLISRVFQLDEPVNLAPVDFDLGKIEASNGTARFWSLLPLYGEPNAIALKKLIGSDGFYYESANEITKIFTGYREKSIFLVSLSYLFIFLLFIFRYGLLRGATHFFPAILSALASVFVLAICGVPLSFFTILALIIVLGLTIDYTIFYLEGGYSRIPPSILISAITTIFSFGILGFSSTPVLAHFGLIIATGVFFSVFLSHPKL